MNGYQPKKQGDGTPPAPPKTGSNVQTPEHTVNVKIETAVLKFPPPPYKGMTLVYRRTICPHCGGVILTDYAEYPNYCSRCGLKIETNFQNILDK